MAGKVIGFVGIDKHELILYLSRILYHLGKRILLVDFAESEALFQSITLPETLREDSCYIDYRGIDFIQGRYFEWKMKKNYDYILMDFGYQSKHDAIPRCTKIIYVTDLQLHNLNRIKITQDMESEDKYLIIKDVISCKIKPEFILEQNDFNILNDHVFILYQDSIDLKVKVHSQYDHKFTFGKLSKPTKFFLKEITKAFDDELIEKQISNAYRKAERGI